TTPLHVVRRRRAPQCARLPEGPVSPLLRGGRASGCRRDRVVTEPLRVARCQRPRRPERCRCKPSGRAGHPFSPGRRMEGMRPRSMRASKPEVPRPEGGDQYLNGLLARVARGDQAAFEAVYDNLAGPVYGLILRVVRDPAQSEEVSQEVLLELWRTASRFAPAKGSAATWAMTIAPRRAVDRVRSAAAAAAREQRTVEVPVPHDAVADVVEASLDAERVRRCLDGLTESQRESITLAYYGGGKDRGGGGGGRVWGGITTKQAEDGGA